MASHGCYPGCGCPEFAAKLEGLIPWNPQFLTPYEYPLTAAPIQHLVCNCNVVWGTTLPIPPCPYHSRQVEAAPIVHLGQVWVGTTTFDPEAWLKLIYGPMAEELGPLIMMELLMHFLPFDFE